MTALKIRARTWGPGLAELGLLVLALCLALWIALAIGRTAEAGLQRWQADVGNADLQLDRKAIPPLTQAWCERDGEAIRLMLPKAYQASCSPRTDGLRQWLSAPAVAARTQAREEAVLAAWQRELRSRSVQLRDLMGRTQEKRLTAELLAGVPIEADSKDAAAALQGEVSLEQQAAEDALRRRAEASQRQERWDRWVEVSLGTLIDSAPGDVDPLALWSAGLSLDGYQGDAGGQMVRRHLSASVNADKAARSLQLHEGLPMLLVFHALLTWLMVAVARRPWPNLAQILALACLGLFFWLGLYLLGGSDNPLRHPRALALLAGAMVILWLIRHFGPKAQAQEVAHADRSPWLLPGWWLFTALGWLLLWDQSLNFHPRLRFLALEQWESWCIAAWLLPLAACTGDALLRLLGSFNAWWLSALSSWQAIVRIALGVALVGAFAVLHRLGFGQYMTGEVAKALVVVVAAGWSLWKLPIIAPLWQAGQARAVLPIVMPAAAILLLAAAIAVVTADKGPFLVVCMVLVVLLSSGVGWAAGIAMVALGFLVMVLVGVDLDVVGARLQAWRDPFSADLDDMARLKWFQAAASESPWGFGPGRTPWCGTAQWDTCYGLPLQLQSDYTFTAIKGWWGPAGGWVFLFLFSAWCFHLMARTARDSVRWTTASALMQAAQAGLALRTHLLFVTALLVLLQTWVTAAGNLGWLPLTGVTWPLVSFGKTSLWMTTLFLGAWGLRRHHA